MSKSSFTREQLQALRDNPWVESATERRIVYTTDFKRKFIEEYKRGKGPLQIFIEAGFDIEALGYKRIERASDRWRTDNNNGKLGNKAGYVVVHRESKRNDADLKSRLAEQEELISELKHENNRLREQLSRLEGNIDRTIVRD